MMERIVRKNQKELRCGLTTGTCAAACAKAAMLNLLTGQVPESVNISLPGGDIVSLKVSKVSYDKSDTRIFYTENFQADICSLEHGENDGASGESPDLKKDFHNSGFGQGNYVCMKSGGSQHSEFFTLKDSGDDPDVTNGTEIHVRIEEVAAENVPPHAFKFESDPSGFGDEPDRLPDGSGSYMTHQANDKKEPGIFLIGGKGVGVVTKPGLHQNIGESAINPVPREMIFRAVNDVLEATGNEEHREIFLITVMVPDGEELAKKTFNPMLGIEGGISILGTTGIVEPMSEASIVATIEVEIRQKLYFQNDKQGKTYSGKSHSDIVASYKEKGLPSIVKENACGNPIDCAVTSVKECNESMIIAVPGNYGKRYAEKLGIDPGLCVTVSNYIGEAIDLAISYGCGRFLLIGNVGKLVKLAAGIMNTHSKVADGRWEIFAAHLALCGGNKDQVRAMREAATTEEMLTRLQEMGLREEVMASIMKEVEFQMEHRIKGKMKFGVIVYSERFGIVGKCGEAAKNRRYQHEFIV
ncbi:MAG: cobalt-precorrin-5B (C(1))-methyltransferase [Lachnospiraceae bacterium]|nr:cobalt-precorrin-5B (C(1))-methyltransferase [Lachnospiraceae bacterium]